MKYFVGILLDFQILNVLMEYNTFIKICCMRLEWLFLKVSVETVWQLKRQVYLLLSSFFENMHKIYFITATLLSYVPKWLYVLVPFVPLR